MRPPFIGRLITPFCKAVSTRGEGWFLKKELTVFLQNGLAKPESLDWERMIALIICVLIVISQLRTYIQAHP